MVIQIKAFKTTDGKIFETELEAYKHECLFLQLQNNSKSKFLTKNGAEISDYISCYTFEEIKQGLNLENDNVSGIYLWYNIKTKMPYIGSSINLYNRSLAFTDISKKYGGQKVDNARRVTENSDWIYFILEKDIEEEKLGERENYYIKKFNSIVNGLNNNAASSRKKYNTNDLSVIKSSYETLIRNIKATNFQVGSTLTLENYISQYEKLNGKLGYGQDKKSWKLSVCIKNKKNVEIDDLINLDYWFSFNLDRPFYGFRNDKEQLPGAIIRYRIVDDSYLSIGDNFTIFKTKKEAFEYHIEQIRKLMFYYIEKNNGTIYHEYVHNLKIKDIIKLKYVDYEKIIEYYDKIINE